MLQVLSTLLYVPMAKQNQFPLTHKLNQASPTRRRPSLHLNNALPPSHGKLPLLKLVCLNPRRSMIRLGTGARSVTMGRVGGLPLMALKNTNPSLKPNLNPHHNLQLTSQVPAWNLTQVNWKCGVPQLKFNPNHLKSFYQSCFASYWVSSWS